MAPPRARSPRSPAPASTLLSPSGGTSTPVPVDFGSLRGVAYDPAGRIWRVGTQLPDAYNTPLIVSRPS